MSSRPAPGDRADYHDHSACAPGSRSGLGRTLCTERCRARHHPPALPERTAGHGPGAALEPGLHLAGPGHPSPRARPAHTGGGEFGGAPAGAGRRRQPAGAAGAAAAAEHPLQLRPARAAQPAHCRAAGAGARSPSHRGGLPHLHGGAPLPTAAGRADLARAQRLQGHVQRHGTGPDAGLAAAGADGVDAGARPRDGALRDARRGACRRADGDPRRCLCLLLARLSAVQPMGHAVRRLAGGVFPRLFAARF